MNKRELPHSALSTMIYLKFLGFGYVESVQNSGILKAIYLPKCGIRQFYVGTYAPLWFSERSIQPQNYFFQKNPIETNNK